jgi:hypothetical protein
VRLQKGSAVSRSSLSACRAQTFASGAPPALEIDHKDKTIDALIKRDRETNYLVRGPQEMLTPLFVGFHHLAGHLKRCAHGEPLRLDQIALSVRPRSARVHTMGQTLSQSCSA